LLHIRNIKKATRTPKLKEILPSDETKSRMLRIAESEMKCAMFLHEHNLHFLLMDHLPKLIKSVCSDSEIAKDLTLCRTKATLITKDCFVPEALLCLKEKMENSVSYSIIMDETIGISTAKSLAIVIRFFNVNHARDSFFGFLEPKDGTAQFV
jgi:hypothetical protein